MMPFQLSPVSILNNVSSATGKELKLACLLRYSPHLMLPKRPIAMTAQMKNSSSMTEPTLASAGSE